MNTATKLCECGCGEEAPIVAKTDARKGWVKGQQARFVAGHHQRMRLSGAAHTGTALAEPGSREITERDIQALREIDEIDAADILDARARMLEKYTRHNFVELGLICMEMKTRELWKRLVSPETKLYFHSWDAWMSSALNVSRTSAYTAYRVVSMGEVSVEDMREMPRRNAMHLTELSSEVRKDPEVIKLAKGSEKTFVARVKEKYPEQKLEPKRQAIATLDDSARTVMDETFEIVRWAYEVENRQDVMENLFAYFLDGPCEREGFTNYTNREAYAAAKKRGVV